MSRHRIATGSKYAYQVLLLDEFKRAGVEVIFLNHGFGQTPEDELLVQVQGMGAEYERAKILERGRRGKRHAALAGSVRVLGQAPYGYRYVPKGAGGGQAHYEIVLEEARVVRQMFDWVGRERISMGEVARRLMQAGVPSRTGKLHWDRSIVWTMLKNPANPRESRLRQDQPGSASAALAGTTRTSSATTASPKPV